MGRQCMHGCMGPWSQCRPSRARPTGWGKAGAAAAAEGREGSVVRGWELLTMRWGKVLGSWGRFIEGRTGALLGVAGGSRAGGEGR
jgi:hypothetical protein